MKKLSALAILFAAIILASSFTPKQPTIAVSINSTKKVLDPFQGWFYYNGLIHKIYGHMQGGSGVITEIRYDDPVSGYNLPVYLSSGTYTSSPTNTFSAVFKYNDLYPLWETVSGEHSGND